jgi:probable rRNA maturation factor
MATLLVDVQVACADTDIPSHTDIQDWVDLAARMSARLTGDNPEVSVRIVDAEEIQTLNKLYREQDKATNVLSFPAGDIDGLPVDAPRALGDIVICASVVTSEAGEQGKQLRDHWAHMLIHGTLHLLGFDHETDAEAREMETLESRILATQNVTDPYV